MVNWPEQLEGLGSLCLRSTHCGHCEVIYSTQMLVTLHEPSSRVIETVSTAFALLAKLVRNLMT